MAMIESSIHLLLRLIVILLAILALGTMFLIVKQKIEEVRNEKVASYKRKVLPEWIDFLNGKTTFSRSMIPLDKYEIQAVESILLAYLHNLRSPGLTEKVSQFANHHLASHYRKMLHSLNWSVRMNALYRTVDFRMSGMKDEMDRLEKKRLTKEERFQLLKFYSLFSMGKFYRELNSPDLAYSEYEYKKLLVELDPEVFNGLITRFEEWRPELQAVLLDVIGYKQDAASLPFLESRLTDCQTELRIRALKAMNEIGFVSKPGIIIPFVESDYWEERLMAAKLFTYVNLSISYPYLLELLKDSSWWVRSQAARTILKHRTGKEKLEEYILNGQDRYAVDMALEVLGKEADELG